MQLGACLNTRHAICGQHTVGMLVVCGGCADVTGGCAWLRVCCLQVKAEFGCFLTWLIAFSVFMLLFQVGLAMQCRGDN